MNNNSFSDSIRDRKYNSGTMMRGRLEDLKECRPLPQQRVIIDWYACPVTLSLNILSQISDSVLIYHSPPGCIDDVRCIGSSGGKMRGMERKNPFQWELNNIHICITNIAENNTIFGSEKKLSNAIREAKRRYNPQFIFVLATCTSAIIGDDIDAVCRTMQDEVGEAKIVSFKTQGFASTSWSNVWDIIWESLINNVVKEQKEKQENLVNIFIPFTYTDGDIKEVERILNELELEARFLPDLTSKDTIERIPDAILNTATCKCIGFHAMKLLNDKFGMPSTETPYLMGTKYSSQWVREIAQLTGRKELGEELIKREIAEIESEFEFYKEKLKGKTIYITINHTKTIGWAQLCHELGMKVISLNFHMLDDISKPHEEEILNEIGNTEVVVGSPLYEELVQISRLKPDIVVAHVELAPLVSSLGFATVTPVNTHNQGSHILFRGMITEARRLYKTYMNPIRKKIFTVGNVLNEHRMLSMPFFYESDHFQFIDKSVNMSENNKCNCKCGSKKKGSCI